MHQAAASARVEYAGKQCFVPRYDLCNSKSLYIEGAPVSRNGRMNGKNGGR